MATYYYKSGWVEKKNVGFMRKFHKRWFQLRHFCVYYYEDEQSGWQSHPAKHNMLHDFVKCNSGTDAGYNGSYYCDGCGTSATPFYHCDNCDTRDEQREASNFKEGVRVQGKWTNGGWYAGVIDQTRDDEYHIKFDDGDEIWNKLNGVRLENEEAGVQFDYCQSCYDKYNPAEDPNEMNSFPDLPDLSLPKLSLPKIKMPDMPDVSMPDVSMPDVSMPDMSMPDLSAPDLSAPNLSMNPKMCGNPKKDRNRYGPWGRLQMYETTSKISGKTVTLENCNWLRIWAGEVEEKGKKKFEIKANDEEEAQSWHNSFVYGGAEDGSA